MAKGYEGIPEMDAAPNPDDADRIQSGSDEQIRDVGEDEEDFDEADDLDEEEEDEDGGV